MDLHTVFILGHIIGTALGLGGAVIAEVQVITALRDGKVDEGERALMHANYFLIRVGLALIIISGLALVWWHLAQGNTWVTTSPKVWVKEIMTAMIIVNAVLLTKHWIPLAVGSAISMTSWLGATVLGTWRSVPYSFTEIFIGYIVATVLVGLFLHLVRGHFIPKKV